MKRQQTNRLTAGLFALVGVAYGLQVNIYLGLVFVAAAVLFLVLSFRRPPKSGDLSKLTPEERKEVERLLKRGKRTKAVKRVRELSGASLLEAKTYVDALEKAT